jgi:hypothetical protein
MKDFAADELEESFACFERAAAQGHEQSIWILSVVKDMDMEDDSLKEAFAKTETPLGWYFAGEFSDETEREAFDFYHKSAEGGCSWGQVLYGRCLWTGIFVEKDEKGNMEWLEKAANQNNPMAMDQLAEWFRNIGGDKEKAVSYYRCAAELGWKPSYDYLSGMLKKGEGCAKNLRQAAIWSAKGAYGSKFWDILQTARVAFEDENTETLDCDFDQLCYSLGWGLYWYQYENDDNSFVNGCLDYYCSCVELQQKSIFTFLLFWNRTTRGVKGPGQMIAQMVWERQRS